MTKNNTEEKDEKILTWKLKSLPTVEQIKELRETGIITKEEARQLLFKEETPKSDADRVAALEEMVKTLQEMTQELLNKPNNIVNVPFVRTIEVAPRQRPYWNEIWMSTGSGSITTTQSLPNGHTAFTVNTGNRIVS